MNYILKHKKVEKKQHRKWTVEDPPASLQQKYKQILGIVTLHSVTFHCTSLFPGKNVIWQSIWL